MEVNLFNLNQTRLERQFDEFHRNNPGVWSMFERAALRLIERGMDHYSADAIMHWVRFETDLKTVGDAFKINNNHIAFYARMFLRKHPSCAGFFDIRVQKHKDGTTGTDAQEVSA